MIRLCAVYVLFGIQCISARCERWLIGNCDSRSIRIDESLSGNNGLLWISSRLYIFPYILLDLPYRTIQNQTKYLDVLCANITPCYSYGIQYRHKHRYIDIPRRRNLEHGLSSRYCFACDICARPFACVALSFDRCLWPWTLTLPCRSLGQTLSVAV